MHKIYITEAQLQRIMEDDGYMVDNPSPIPKKNDKGKVVINTPSEEEGEINKLGPNVMDPNGKLGAEAPNNQFGWNSRAAYRV